MHTLKRAVFVCAAMALFIPAAAAQTLDEIVAKNLEAKGGVERLRGTQTMRLSGTLTQRGGRGTTVTLSKRPNLFRRELDVAGQKMTQGFDGTTLWISVSGMPAQEMPAGPQTDALKRAVDFDAAFLDWKQKGHTLEYKGKVTEGAKSYHHLVFTPKGGPPIEYYLDPETGLEAKTIMQVESPGMKGKMETRFTDYRTIEGRTMPFVMTNFVDGAQVAQVRLDRVEFDVPLDDALFKMPK
jgi:outer membrane lipoprotein-sorting protein